MKIKRTIFFLIMIVILMAIFVISRPKELPYEYLINNMEKSDENIVSEVLDQAEVDKNKYLIFYLNENSNICCAIIKKKLLNYKILTISGEVILINDNKEHDYIYSSYGNGSNREWIEWGILRSKAIETVLIANEEASIIDLEKYNVRLYYFMGKNSYENIEPEHSIIYRTKVGDAHNPK